MMEFKPILLSDRELITSYILPGKRRDANLSFVNLFCWHFLTCSSYTIVENQLVLRFCFPEEVTAYSIVDNGDDALFDRLVAGLARQAMEEKRPLYLYGILPDLQQQLDKRFPEVFEYRSSRDYFDYIYLCKDLAELTGKEYRTKRNHVNKFQKTYEFRYLPMDEQLIPDCLKMYDEWCSEHHCAEDYSLEGERQALEQAMGNFRELELSGGVLLVGGKVIAFTFGTPVNHDTFCVHAEKALAGYEGAYNMINYEFSKSLQHKYIYLNREEDMGLPGLRKAKLSYRPAELLEKGLAVCAEGLWDKLL